MLERQVQWLVGAGPDAIRRRAGILADRGYLSCDQIFSERHYQIRKAGLVAIDSALSPPEFKLPDYKHDVGLAWLWLAAHGGRFGPLREVVSERQMRSHDGTFERPPEPYGVRLGGLDRYGNDRLHYPDLLLIDPHDRRIALELELTGKGRKRLELTLGGYGADSRIDRVLYLVEDHRRGRAVKRALEQVVDEMGLPDRVRFQLVTPFCVAADGAGHTAARPARARLSSAKRRPDREPAQAGR